MLLTTFLEEKKTRCKSFEKIMSWWMMMIQASHFKCNFTSLYTWVILSLSLSLLLLSLTHTLSLFLSLLPFLCLSFFQAHTQSLTYSHCFKLTSKTHNVSLTYTHTDTNTHTHSHNVPLLQIQRMQNTMNMNHGWAGKITIGSEEYGKVLKMILLIRQRGKKRLTPICAFQNFSMKCKMVIYVIHFKEIRTNL